MKCRVNMVHLTCLHLIYDNIPVISLSPSLSPHVSTSERSLWADERISDVIAKWEIFKKSIAGSGFTVSFAFMFKQQIFLMDEKVEISDVSILSYHQVYHIFFTSIDY